MVATTDLKSVSFITVRVQVPLALFFFNLKTKKAYYNIQILYFEIELFTYA